MSTRGVNKAILIGHLGQEPVTRFMANGNAVTNITLATSESWKDKTSGQTMERTEWHRVVFFSRLAEIAGEYLKKGSKAYIEGKMVTRKWKDKEGRDQYSTEIHASELQLLDSREGSAGSATPTPAPAQPAMPSNPSRPLDDFDDDIPF